LFGSGIYQDLDTTAGAEYILDFWLRYDDAQVPVNSIAVHWGSEITYSDANVGPFPFMRITVPVTASSASTRLRFVFQTDFGEFNLDDVSVTQASAAVPEPASLSLFGIGGCITLLGRAMRKRKPAP
jgi:hypothetical protein